MEGPGVLVRSWNPKRPLFFAHFVLMQSLGLCRAKVIRAQITIRIDLWERGLHTGLVGDAEAEGASREGSNASR